MFALISFIAGLIVGWNFLSQPVWVKQTIDKLASKLKF